MSHKVRWVHFYPDEWIAGTAGLPADEKGVYWDICALIFSHGGRITQEMLRRVTVEHGNKLNAILSHLVAIGKIVVSGEEIGQKRAENELERSEKRARNARENGAKRSANRDLRGATADRKSTSNQNQNKKEVVEAKASPPSSSVPSPPSLRSVGEATAPPAVAVAVAEVPERDFVKELWDRGLAMLGPTNAARNLLGKLRREYGDVAVLDALGACEAEAPSNPPAFLAACLRQRSSNGRQRRNLSPQEELWIAGAKAVGFDGPDHEAAGWLLGQHGHD